MKLATFFKKFELFADAPDAVAKMRKLILELAVQGKLVRQDQNEEPASKLVEIILGEKKDLIHQRLLRSTNSHTLRDGSSDNDTLPIGWEWVTLNEISDIGTGSTPLKSQRAYYENGKIPWITSAATNNEFISVSEQFVTELAVSECRLRVYPRGSLVVALYGQGKTRGQVGQLMFDSTTNQACAVIAFFGTGIETASYIRLFFKKKYDELRKQAAGGAQPNLSGGMIRLTRIPLPPLAEQKRIVAKVDELMALCDQLEREQQERETRHAALARASLARFAETPTPANLKLLFHKSYDIAPSDLRKSILTLAVQGKLAPQVASEANVESILDRNDKQRKVTAENDRRAKPDSQTILSAEDRWTIPGSWHWRALADLVLFVDYRGKTPKKLSKGIRLLTAKNVRKGTITLSPHEFISQVEYDDWMTRGIPQKGDVLFTTEAPMGYAAVVELSEIFALAQRVICFQSYGAIDPYFIVLQILSEQFQFILEKNGTGMTAKGIKASKLKQLPIAIPPLAEQRRIVAKVDQLMALVDELETQLTTSRTQAAKLLEAVVAELTVA